MLDSILLSIRYIGLPARLAGLSLWLALAACGCNRISSTDRTGDQGDSASANPASSVLAAASPHDRETLPDPIATAERALARGHFDVAQKALTQRLLAAPDDPHALELSADVASHRGDYASADTLYHSAIRSRGKEADRNLLDKWSKCLIRAGRPYDAIDALQELGERFPGDVQSRYDLAGLAAACGVPEEAVPAMRWLVQRGQSDPESLLLLADPARVEPDAETCQKFLAISGESRRPEFGLAKLDALHQKWAAVATRLEPVVKQSPQFAPAYALYGQALLELEKRDQLIAWRAMVPESALASAHYWIVVGRWEQTQGHHEQAARAFWESLQRDSTSHPEMLAQLLVSLHQLGRTEDAGQVTKLIVKHTELRDAIKIHLERLGESQAACMRVANAMMDMGRIWEAEGWARVAVSLPREKLPDLRARYMAIRNELSVQTPWQLPAGNAASLVDLKALSSTSPGDTSSPADVSVQGFQGHLAFSDQARQRGWVHTSIAAPTAGGHTIEQSVGGGLAVIDFDCDGWPDLVAATLDGTALHNDSSPNRLSRNLDGTFVDVSAAANYQDTGFGQGIAVGDYNDDGFPDLFDANIGRNRLYRNNGDGTFTDVSDSVGLRGETWTTSVALVDLNGDSILDLYEANYCAGKEPYEHECHNKFGLGTCSPLLFDAEPDRVWRGCHDGTFIEETAAWMNQTTPGRGLGLVVGELDEQRGIDVLVANDMTVNHLWSPQLDGQPFELADLGVVRGLGTGGNSRSQASMGIAAADANGDGHLDLFMTHFSDDYNTYYEQIAPGFWSDRSYRVGLGQPSMKMLGFGTQWADFDNGGELELIVANGHVDRVDRDDVGYRMPPQLFHRVAGGQWEQWESSALGEYFTNDHLGRALVVLDANRDGRCDVAISHLDDPAALLINQTPDAGRSVTMELKATSSPRDAIGARVVVSIGAREYSAQLTAGDGYMASNQRRIHIGCGQARSVDEVTVHWPSGQIEPFGSLPSGRDYLLVEGSADAQLMWEHP